MLTAYEQRLIVRYLANVASCLHLQWPPRHEFQVLTVAALASTVTG